MPAAVTPCKIAPLPQIDKLNLSGKEKKRLVECFKDKEFVKMFQDYCEEIADPANRVEYEQYIGMFLGSWVGRVCVCACTGRQPSALRPVSLRVSQCQLIKSCR